MPIADWIEKLGRTVFEAPFDSLDPATQAPEIAEIRLSLIEEIKNRSHVVARRRVFPYNLVKLKLYGIAPEQQSILTGGFFAGYCESELKAGLERSGYRFPEDLEVSVAATAELPFEGGKWVAVEVESKPAAEAGVAPAVRARLIVERGSANIAELVLDKTRTNIGRSAEVYRTDGPSRRNDLAFDEAGDLNSTVSREHAHILLDSKTGQYRLFNDRWDVRNAGLWVLRDGLSQAVRRDVRGFLLQDGDEIHLGRAVLKFVQR